MNFVLRTIADGVETNYLLGTSYSIVERDVNRKEFDKLYLKVHGDEHALDSSEVSEEIVSLIHSFVVGSNRDTPFSVYRDHKNFIMTDSGQTFSRINK
jgi:hypothetical protein